MEESEPGDRSEQPRDRLGDRFRRHAGDSQHLYGYTIRAMADDWEAGGVVREVFAGYENAAASSVVQLRLLAGVFRLVLTQRAPELEPYYPCLGGQAAPSNAWPTMRAVIMRHMSELRTSLEVAPQTNEVGRCAALLVGLLDLARTSGHPRVRLRELGASAGLNLLLDRYAVHGPGWRYGPADSPVQLRDAVEGDIDLRPLTVLDRCGCDPHPVDPTSAEGRLLLTSFVWPFDVHRHERLSAALQVVESDGRPRVDRASASDWLPTQLAAADADALLVVWNSITAQYWPAAEVDRVEQILAGHGAQRPLARVTMEFRPDAPGYEEPEIRTTYWPGDGSPARHRLIGSAHHHGLPVRLRR